VTITNAIKLATILVVLALSLPGADCNRGGSVCGIEASNSLPLIPSSSILTSIRQLHQLSPPKAAMHPQAVVEGIVTGLTFMPHGFTVQDETEGIYVVFRTTKTSVKLGHKIRISGTVDPGAFAPILIADRVQVLGYGTMPQPRKIRPADLDGGVLDNQYVEVRGFVRSYTRKSDGNKVFGIMKLDVQPAGSVLLLTRDLGDNLERYVDSVVRARGVAAVEFNERRQALGLRVVIENIGDVTIERAAPTDPFSQPITPIDNIMLFGPVRDWARRLHIRGLVTLQRPGRFVVVQEGNSAIRVETRTHETLPEGTRLDAAGFVSTEGYSPILKDAVIRTHGMSMAVKPLPQHAVDLLTGSSDWSLVTVTGTLIESGQSSTGLTLLIEDHGAKFSAELANGRPEQFNVASGSQIQITGICEIFSGALREPEGFRLLLRSISDVKVVKGAPLLMNRTVLIRGGVCFAALTMLSGIWAITLRLRVRQQTRWITASLAKEKAAATQDLLTGIANRRHFEDSLAPALRDAEIAGGEVALFYIDIGNFKNINDTLGHTAGDLLLKQIAQRLDASLDSMQILSRIGGDEFAVIQPMASGKQSSEDLASRLLASFRDPFLVASSRIQVAASIGISRYPIDGEDGEQLLQNADMAMYHAKRNGKGSYFFDSAIREAIERRLAIRKLLPGAAERGEFFAQYQPIENLSNGLIVRFEALCRWNNPQLGSVSPLEFIPIAEETGQIHAIGHWILDEACLQGRRWQKNKNAPVHLAVNLSAVQFLGEEFVDNVTRILAITGFPAHLLELELTESVLIREAEESIRKMHRLRKLGVELSIDDFGTGYSSLSYLQTMPIDAVKIDRSFTASLDSSPAAVTMVRSIIAMARTLGLRVVTEGVESSSQLEIVRQLGSDEAQGFYLGKPDDAETALKLVMYGHSRYPTPKVLQDSHKLA